jgi:hypothetical protein
MCAQPGQRQSAGEPGDLRPLDRSADAAAGEANLPSNLGEGQTAVHDRGVAQHRARVELRDRRTRERQRV